MSDQLIYLDNAATTFPRPRQVLDSMCETYARLGVSPGRGSYDLSVEAEDFVSQTRQQLASFFGAPDPNRVVFASNATDALNLAIQGMVRPGDHVVSTQLEHNSVLRPLHHLKERGWIDYDLVPFDGAGLVHPEEVVKAIRPTTRLAIICHASNVLGTVQPVAEIARFCAARGVPVLIDTAQSAGHIPIDMTTWNVSAVAFTGHKSLMGPSGIGGLAVAPDMDIQSSRFGGTGIESRSPVHTQAFPHRLEAGTLNLLGIIGLRAGLDYLQEQGMERNHHREISLIRRLHQGLASLPGVTVYSPIPRDTDVPVLVCNVHGMGPSDVGAILDGDYNIAVRTGQHCAPLVHAALGTESTGAIRFSVGYANNEEDIDIALEAMSAISRSRK